jgi:CHAT domain-containing protein/Tfp pilus assembly protein PilF
MKLAQQLIRDARRYHETRVGHRFQARNGVYWILCLALLLGIFTSSRAQVQQSKGAEPRSAIEENRALEQARRSYEEALNLQRRGKFAEAIPIAERALEIREKLLGAEHLDVAVVLNSLGRLYYEKSNHPQAESLHQRALTIREKALGGEHLLVAESLNNLAIVFQGKGDYSRAEPLYQRALAIREKTVGAEDALVAQSLHNLANLNKAKGDYVRAVLLYQRAIAIREKALGSADPNLATSLNNLANLYREMGDYSRSEQLHLRVLAIWEKALGPEHPDVADSLNNLALMYFRMGEYAKAEPLYQRALAIREKIFGPEHPLLASSINNLANLYRDQGDIVRAEPLHLRALAIWEKALGPEHRIVASSLNDVANMYREKGDYDKAEPLYQRALAIREKALAAQHPAIALLLNDFAVMYRAKGDTTKAVKLLARANEIREYNLALILTTGSEEQKRLYLTTLSDETDASLSLHVHSAIDDLEAARLALTNILRRKGRVLDIMRDQVGALRSRLTPEDQLLLDQSSAARAQLASLVLGDSAKTDPAQNRAKIADLSAEVERLEAAISRRSVEFRSQTRAVTLEAVQKALPSDTALVEIVEYRPFNQKAMKRDERFGAQHYVAYVLKGEGAPRSVELGDAATIDADVARLRTALADPKSIHVKELARALDEKVMKPVRALLGNATHLLVSPDGELNLIPFEALVDEHEQGRYLIERYAFTYLSSGRDLLRMESALETVKQSIAKPLVVANPSFGEPVPEQIASLAVRSSGLRNRRSVTSARSLSEVYFAPLSGTAREASTIKQLFPETNLLTDVQATESAIKQSAAPRILHIATHGFFLSEPPASAGGDRGSSPTVREGSVRNSPGVGTKNPLLRSGLALANANRRSGSGDDGILTALEASGLNLWGTKLVVLSACDTGVGEVRNGEGVYGLRRAFVLAGGESLVMSLWPVSDYPTKKLMTEFYQNLKQGMGRGAALHQAQLKMVKAKLHPFYWANFIQSGEWANLEGQR